MLKMEVGEAIISFDGSVVKFEGDFVSQTQLEDLQDALNELHSKIQHLTSAKIDVTESADCVSLLLKPVIAFLRDVSPTKLNWQIAVLEDEGEVIPWHEVVVKYLHRFSSKNCQIDVEKVPAQ